MTEKTTGAEAQEEAGKASQPDKSHIHVTGHGTEAEVGEAASEAEETTTQEQEEPQKAHRVPESMQKAFDKLAFERRDAERRLKQAQADLANRDALIESLRRQGMSKAEATEEANERKPETAGLNQADIDRLANERAQKIADERLATERQTAAKTKFDEECNTAYLKGKEMFGDFDDALKNLGMLGLDGDSFAGVFETALATDSPHQVLYKLGQNPDEAEKILAMSPAKMAIAFAKLAAAPPKIEKTISAAPPPNRPLGGSQKIDAVLRDEESDEAWFAKRRAYKRERGLL